MVLKHTWLILAISCCLLYFKQGQKFLKTDKVEEKRGEEKKGREEKGRGGKFPRVLKNEI